ncbi:F-box domain-containing protein [Caenorhabditis elegans]|uniref:F-box domain-containing protein n=1 Tax=Caenorhabditis elegans TaxID=6239 RepID=Q9U2N4_CAEEL|nr:F-box domain-containing protein [Caenorhabditis elegans]CAB60576.3 F-box domain-containing protein [Caenorhabditis elegans]|eukprot:NP_507539.3 Uncharacterized protein CELE_Y37H2A.7 [Caenorhabditis elegans]
MTDPDDNANLLTLRQDKNAQQACILYQILQKTEIFDAFNIFCDVFRENSMEYREFEFFFYQLGKENAELGSELRFNPKSRQLLELPDDMLNKIFDCVKPIELFPIRKVSRRFRDVIDRRAPRFKQIELNIANFCLSMNFDDDDEDVQYSRDEDEDEEGFTIEYKEHETHVAKGSVVEAGLSDLYRIMKNPKFSLETLDVTFCEYLRGENMELVENMMKKLKSIQVKVVILRDAYSDTIDHVLPYLEPGKLEDIHFEAHSWLAKCDRVIKTEQFKLAKRFFMDGGGGGVFWKKLTKKNI